MIGLELIHVFLTLDAIAISEKPPFKDFLKL
jgi:hypothetical protein